MPHEQPVNILIVDNQLDNLLLVEAILRDLGHNVVKAGSGQEALAKLLEDDYAVILLDVQMPEMDGFETAARIREHDRLQHTPIIFLTGIYKSNIYAFKGYSLGAVDYLYKPFDPEILKAKVNVFIDLFRKKEEMKRQADKIRRLNEDLERRILERTAELRAANEELRNEIIERKRAEEALRESEERYRNLFENANDIIYTHDLAGNFTSLNKAGEQITGYTREDILKMNIAQVMASEQLDVARRWLKQVLSGGRAGVLELEIRARNGRRVVLEISPQLIHQGGKVVGVQGIARDINERKRTEEALQQAKEMAEAANRAKSEFLANMSHEIRTPMNAIIGMADLLWEAPLTPEQREYVQIFRRAGETLLNLINDILDLSKVEAGRLDLQEIDFDLGDLVERTVEILAMRAHEKGLEVLYKIAHDVPMSLIGDPDRLRQVLFNLIGNAIKFTERGEVALHITKNPASKEPGSLLFSVRDTGVGVAPEKRDAIFDRFTHVDPSTTHKQEGAGLGLTISKRLVALMGGDIRVESEVGKGSTFYFTAQFGIRVGPKRSAVLPSVDLRGVKALVVDDNATNRLILREMLSAQGIHVIEAESGRQGIAELQRAKDAGAPFQLVLLDSRMPGTDGFQVVEQIKRELGMTDMTIMMLNSDNRRGDIARCQELGVSAHLVKPVKRLELFEAITVAIGKTKAAALQPPAVAKSDLLQDPRPLRILLAEDSIDNRLVIQFFLKKTRYELDIAENGAAAVGKFKSGRYDLVLMDIQMPVMDGYMATKAIRRWESERQLRRTPVIALTAYALEEEVQKSLDVGCTDHVAKPIKKANLMETIQKYTRV